jgi:predicted alpha/beta superfamily hydrolase
MSDFEVRAHPEFSSQYLPGRELLVALPPLYAQEADRRYPVFYLHDGQNLFGDAVSPVSGRGWQIDRAAARLIEQGELDPIIMVGIPNLGERRRDEYTPTYDAERQAGGKGHAYGRMLVEEIKPFIDRTYRTLPDPDATALGGSSLGALISIYLGVHYPQVFSKLALLSIAAGWDHQVIVREVDTLPEKLPLRIWLDMGTAESQGMLDGARALRDALVRKGWVIGDDLQYVEAEGAIHDEGPWAERSPDVLRYLFPRR